MRFSSQILINPLTQSPFGTPMKVGGKRLHLMRVRIDQMFSARHHRYVRC